MKNFIVTFLVVLLSTSSQAQSVKLSKSNLVANQGVHVPGEIGWRRCVKGY
jgi:hypothetical protein